MQLITSINCKFSRFFFKVKILTALIIIDDRFSDLLKKLLNFHQNDVSVIETSLMMNILAVKILRQKGYKFYFLMDIIVK